ncbi:hypothetical protein TNCV_2658911 [Trichonephila clavipes]|nr:hypothetical protein TNCV_2658911 [Trichonephila clavipes]
MKLQKPRRYAMQKTGFKMLMIVTSMQKESGPDDDETDEDEDNTVKVAARQVISSPRRESRGLTFFEVAITAVGIQEGDLIGFNERCSRSAFLFGHQMEIRFCTI